MQKKEEKHPGQQTFQVTLMVCLCKKDVTQHVKAQAGVLTVAAQARHSIAVKTGRRQHCLVRMQNSMGHH